MVFFLSPLACFIVYHSLIIPISIKIPQRFLNFLFILFGLLVKHIVMFAGSDGGENGSSGGVGMGIATGLSTYIVFHGYNHHFGLCRRFQFTEDLGISKVLNWVYTALQRQVNFQIVKFLYI